MIRLPYYYYKLLSLSLFFYIGYKFISWCLLSMFHTITFPNGDRLVLNIMDVSEVIEARDDQNQFVTLFHMRNGHNFTVNDPRRELIDEFLAQQRGYGGSLIEG